MMYTVGQPIFEDKRNSWKFIITEPRSSKVFAPTISSNIYHLYPQKFIYENFRQSTKLYILENKSPYGAL